MADETPLKLAALDAEDLSVISAYLQDAVLQVGAMRYLPTEQRFAATFNRFDWIGTDTPTSRRKQTALVIDKVGAVRSQNIKQGQGDAVLELLAIEFASGDAPSGHIELIFAGGGALRLEVECIEARLADLGPAWETGSRPGHDTTDTKTG